MDCDTAWVGSGKLPIGAPISACIVDAANPPERILLNIFNASGLGAQKWARVGFPMGSGHEFTDANNCNGGLYICDRDFVPKLARFWRFWALWCLDRSELLESFAVHVDQVSFALAMRELRASVHHLPIAWNYPAHLRVECLPDVSPQVIHYHHELTAELTIKTVGIPTVDRSIGHLNDAIEALLRGRPLRTVLQKFRDDLDPGRGQTGYGSIADTATQPSSGPLHASRHRSTSIRGDLGKVVVGSGWWCDEQPHEWAIGSPATRSVEFFKLWYEQVERCLRPDRIVITDSASPLKPDYRRFPVEWIELDRNYGQPNDIRIGRIVTKYSGFTRSVINGAMYALCCDADFYVYVEQDCLLHGEDFLPHVLGDTSADILLGAPTENGRGLGGDVAASMLQQSLMIVRRAGLERFLAGLLGAPWSDGEVSPEEIMKRQLAPFEFIQVPYGRSRPIDFSRSHFYAQHLDDDELRHLSKINDGDVPALEVDVWRRGGIGDVLMCTPALRELKRARPGSRIRLYTDYPSLVGDLPYIDDVMPIEATPPDAVWLEYETRIPPPPHLHLSKIIGETLGVEVTDVRPDCVIDPALVARFRAAWQGLQRPHIVINRHASSWTPNKAWPEGHWTELIRRLSQNASVIEVGASPGMESDDFGDRYVDLRGLTTLEEFVAAIAAADLNLGPMSGPVHIAAAVGKRSVVIIGGYEGPSNAGYPSNIALYTPVECAPCWLDAPCPYGLRCLNVISPDQVERAVWSLWNEIRADA
jgi:ADP-heptose:LPS heptosyltransferase